MVRILLPLGIGRKEYKPMKHKVKLTVIDKKTVSGASVAILRGSEFRRMSMLQCGRRICLLP